MFEVPALVLLQDETCGNEAGGDEVNGSLLSARDLL